MTFGTGGGFTSIQMLQQNFNAGSNQTTYTVPLNTISYIRSFETKAPSGANVTLSIAFYDGTSYSASIALNTALVGSGLAPRLMDDPGFSEAARWNRLLDAGPSSSDPSHPGFFLRDRTLLLLPTDRILITTDAPVTLYTAILEQSVS